ncbi:hypothetical protein ACFL27_28755, partial [candidate division CSSED10-310 bacterium]
CLVDDLYISLRYARNLVEGQGLVFNPGERVQGYTNFLFVLLAALFLQLKLDPVTCLQGVVFLSALFTIGGTVRLERILSIPERQLPYPLAPLFLLPMQAFVFWGLCPMETMFFTVLLVWGLVYFLKDDESGVRWRALLCFHDKLVGIRVIRQKINPRSVCSSGSGATIPVVFLFESWKLSPHQKLMFISLTAVVFF